MTDLDDLLPPETDAEIERFKRQRLMTPPPPPVAPPIAASLLPSLAFFAGLFFMVAAVVNWIGGSESLSQQQVAERSAYGNLDPVLWELRWMYLGFRGWMFFMAGVAAFICSHLGDLLRRPR